MHVLCVWHRSNSVFSTEQVGIGLSVGLKYYPDFLWPPYNLPAPQLTIKYAFNLSMASEVIGVAVDNYCPSHLMAGALVVLLPGFH